MTPEQDTDRDRISVVIPTKDRLPYLRHCLKVFLAEPEVGQVVVVNDGSSDGTREFLLEESRSEPRLLVHDNGRNRGIPFAKNRGVERATCSTIFIGEDDLDIEAGFFATLLSHRDGSTASLIAPRNIFRLEHESLDETRKHRDEESPRPTIDRRCVENDPAVFLEEDTQQLLRRGPILEPAHIFKSTPLEERIRNNSWREEADFQVSVQE